MQKSKIRKVRALKRWGYAPKKIAGTLGISLGKVYYCLRKKKDGVSDGKNEKKEP